MLVGLARIELATSALSVLRSNRLSYSPVQGPTIYPAGGSMGFLRCLDRANWSHAPLG